MTSRIIYHNFQQKPAENRFSNLLSRVNTALNNVCVFMCGVCSGISILILLLLTLSM